MLPATLQDCAELRKISLACVTQYGSSAAKRLCAKQFDAYKLCISNAEKA